VTTVLDGILEHLRRVRHDIDVIEREVLRFQGVEIPTGRARLKLPEAEVAEARRVYERGVPMIQLAAHMGYSPEILKRELIAAGVRLRGRGGSHPQRRCESAHRAVVA